MTSCYELYNSCRHGDLSVVQMMITKGAKGWNSGLLGACHSGHLHLVKLMIEKGADNFKRGMDYACIGGHLEIVQLMIDLGANDWNSGFWNAHMHDQLHIVKFMIDLGATNIHELTNKQAYQLLEMGVPRSRFEFNEGFQQLSESIQIFQKQVFKVANCYLIPELANMVSQYSLK